MRALSLAALLALAGCYTQQQAARLDPEHRAQWAQWQADRARADSLAAVHPDSLSDADVVWLARYAVRPEPPVVTANREAARMFIGFAVLGLAVLTALLIAR